MSKAVTQMSKCTNTEVFVVEVVMVVKFDADLRDQRQTSQLVQGFHDGKVSENPVLKRVCEVRVQC